MADRYLDRADKLTDQQLAEIEKKLDLIYRQAEKDIAEKVDTYYKRFEVLDRQKRILVDAGRMSEEDYKRWLQYKIATGEHWREMQRQIAERLTNADREAMAFVNNQLPQIYAMNYDAMAESIQNNLRGGFSFEMVDASTVRYLATTDKTLLPYKTVNGQKAERWHTQRVNANVTQGILQGESIPKIAKRLKTELGMTAKGSAVRNARTTVTSAENKGRMDMLHDAAEKGVLMNKVWLAAHDSRTREAHMELDGVEEEVDTPFVNSFGEIMYPGDTDADPANVYNCRCTLVYHIVGFKNPQTGEVKKIGFYDSEETEKPSKTKTETKAAELEKPAAPKIADVSPGKPMSHDEADSGNVNPNFSAGGGYRINCQSCCPTYEARLRGYDVEVVPNDAQHPMCKTLSHDTSLVWKNKDGSPAEFMFGKGWTYSNDWNGPAPTAKRFEKLLHEKLEEGARYHLGFGWKGYRSGHIVTLRLEGKELVIYDPQCDRMYRAAEVSDYLTRIRYQTTTYGYKYYKWPEVMRVDDKVFDFDIANQIMKAKY